MPINRHRLKSYRDQLNLSLDQLACRAKVNRSTIHRIETGKKEPRANTIQMLAIGLGVHPSDLTSNDDLILPTPPKVEAPKSQLGFKVGNEARNALAFVAERYGVKQATVVKLAALLFVLAAESSLNERRRNLQKVRDCRLEIGSCSTLLREGGEELELREEYSISQKDIFGRILDDEDVQWDPWDGDVDEVGKYNPFAEYLRAGFGQHGGADRFLDWHSSFGPEFEVGLDEARTFAGGDDLAVTMLVQGAIGVHEVPVGLRGDEMADQRADWLRTRAKAVEEVRQEQAAAMDARLAERAQAVAASIRFKI